MEMNPLWRLHLRIFHIAPTSDLSFCRAFMLTSNILCLELRGTQRCNLQSHRLHQYKSENPTSTWFKKKLSGRGWNKAFYLPYSGEVGPVGVGQGYCERYVRLPQDARPMVGWVETSRAPSEVCSLIIKETTCVPGCP